MTTNKYYIEAYYADDTPLLGNLDGQGVMYAQRYRQTNQYKELRNRKFDERIAYHLIICANSRRIVEIIDHRNNGILYEINKGDSMTFKPMLSPGNDPMSYPNYFKELKFPLLVSPKLDGIRCIVKNRTAYSRTFKELPNEALQSQIYIDGDFELDGELIEGDPTASDVYNKTLSVVMSGDKPINNLRYFVFDDPSLSMKDWTFIDRLISVKRNAGIIASPFIKFLEHTWIDNLDDLLEFELRQLQLGYEGIMMKCPYGRYKHGRGTWKEGLIYKLKRFQDDEAIIVDFGEMMHNTNEGIRNELGYIERSDTKDAKEGSGMVGKFICEFNGELIEVAAGQFSHDERKLIWNQKDQLVGAVIKFRHFTIGVKDKPRFPRAVGFRDKMDM